MKPYVCKELDVCNCYVMALEPNENCPIHGYGSYLPRCGE